MSDPLGRPHGATALALGLLLIPVVARAQDWDETYRSGLTALARGDNARAAEALRRAIALHPEPGRNVPTYGTNVQPRYFPYLRLAEACLALGQLEAAREALDKSDSWGDREPAEERHKLRVRLDAAAAQRRSPAPTPAPPTSVASAVPPTPTAAATIPPETHPSASPPSAAVAPSAALPAPREPLNPGRVLGREGQGRGASSAGGSVPSAPPVEPVTGTLEIMSEPAGASTYIDDEPVGITDPQTGRLVKTGLRPGRHRVRVARAGHEDAVREVDIVRGGAATFHATLTPLTEVSPGTHAGFVAVALLAIGLVAVFAWIALRRPEGLALGDQPTPSRGPTAKVSTPPEQLNPGVRNDELGQEWFGDFRLLEMLGRGGMASVFKVDRRGEISALKRPRERLLDDPQFRERFLREAEIGRSLNHPNIIRILERGIVGRVPYFTMELLPGETLEAYLGRRGPAAARAAVAIVVQVAEALDFAHSKDVVHRDLKPSNVMLLPDGTAKVMDFGLARALRFESLTATAAFVGTPNYVAPETIEGHGTDARSDLYAVGLILYRTGSGARAAGMANAFTYPRWSVGLLHHLPLRSSFEGRVATRTSGAAARPEETGNGTLRFPREIGLGGAWRPATRWTVGLDLTWDDWRAALIETSAGGPQPGRPISIFDGLPPDQTSTRNTLSVNAGAEHLFPGEGFVVPLRFGLAWEPQGGRDAYTRDPVSYVMLAAGTGYNTNSLKFDAAFQLRWAHFLTGANFGVVEVGPLPLAVGERDVREWRLKLSLILRVTDTDKLHRTIRKVFGGSLPQGSLTIPRRSP